MSHCRHSNPFYSVLDEQETASSQKQQATSSQPAFRNGVRSNVKDPEYLERQRQLAEAQRKEKEERKKIVDRVSVTV